MKGHSLKTRVEFFKGKKKICKLLSHNEINLDSTPCPRFGSQRGDRVVINRPGSGFTPLFNLPELVRKRYLNSPITTQRRLWADTARYSQGVAHRHCRPTLPRLSAGLHGHRWSWEPRNQKTRLHEKKIPLSL